MDDIIIKDNHLFIKKEITELKTPITQAIKRAQGDFNFHMNQAGKYLKEAEKYMALSDWTNVDNYHRLVDEEFEKAKEYNTMLSALLYVQEHKTIK